jgi:hypothetical protein
MAVRTVFNDSDNNEMECYLNDKGRVFISIGQTGEDITYNGYITLDKEDVGHLIKMLTEMEQEMPD